VGEQRRAPVLREIIEIERDRRALRDDERHRAETQQSMPRLPEKAAAAGGALRDDERGPY